MQQPLKVSLKKAGLSLPGLENTAKRCVVTVDHVGKHAFDSKKCFCYGSSASPASGAVIIKWCTSWLAAWLTLLCCRFSAFSWARPSLFSCQLTRFTASCKLVCRGSVVHPIRHGYCRSVLLLAGSRDLNHTLTIAGFVWRHRKRPHTGFIVSPTYTQELHTVLWHSTPPVEARLHISDSDWSMKPFPMLLPSECHTDVTSKYLFKAFKKH